MSSRIPKNAKYTGGDIALGTKIELEHTRDRRLARNISIQHLNEHYTYYRVLPAAEQFMSILENKKPQAHRKHRQTVQNMPSGFYGYGR
jgi:hypothetical protein